MSGRLVILPKKSYCPWRIENVERVLRDERLDRERREREAAAEKERTSQHRMTQLRSQPTSKSDKSESKASASPKPFRLFQAEEDEWNRRVAAGEQSKSFDEEEKKRSRCNADNTSRLYLGQTELKGREQNRPFYIRSNSRPLRVSSESKRKHELDPMVEFSGFQRHCQNDEGRHNNQSEWNSGDQKESSLMDSSDKPSRREKIKHKKEKRRKKEKKRRREQNEALNKLSIESLRQRRKAREVMEAKRAEALTDNGSEEKRSGYNDLYYPDFRRK